MSRSAPLASACMAVSTTACVAVQAPTNSVSHLALICTFTDAERSSQPFIVSFRRMRDHFSNIWVIHPDGSQTTQRWRGETVAGGYVLTGSSDCCRTTLRIQPDTENPARARMVYDLSTPLLGDQAVADCNVRTASQVSLAA